MRTLYARSLHLALTLAMTVISGIAAADDTEIFNLTATSPSNPNILFILDTSGSMSGAVNRLTPYDSNTTYDSTYTHACDPSQIYFETGTTQPTCGSAATRRNPEVPASPSFASTDMKCSAANSGLSSNGLYGGTGSGDNAIRWITMTTAVNRTATPSTTTRTRSVTHSGTYSGKVVRYTQRSNSASGPWNDFGTPTTTTNPTYTSSSSSAGSWSGASTNPTGAPATVTSVSSSASSYWSTDISSPVSTSSNTTPTITPTGSASTSTGTINWTQTSSTQVGGDTVVVAAYRSGSRWYREVTRTYNGSATGSATQTESTPSTSTADTTSTSYVAADVECDGDKETGTSGQFPKASDTQWTSTKSESYWDNNGGLQQYTFYSGNYLNYLHNPPSTYEGTRLEVMQNSIENLVNSMSGVNVGLMRYSNNGDDTSGSNDNLAQGGMVSYPATALDASSKSDIITIVNGYDHDGYTPLSETLYEAYLYYSGSTVKFGDTSKDVCTGSGWSTTCNSAPSVAASRVGDSLSSHTYKSPIVSQCQKNYVVYLTDGLPTQDTQANTLIQSLPDFSSLGGTCNSDGGNGSHGICLGALAQYMNHADLNASLDGPQGVASYFIGFGDDFAASGQLNAAFDYLKDAATRGGGAAYSATDAAQLSSVLTKIVSDAITRNTSFSAPSVAVNAFNRTTTLNDVYISVFQPTTTMHWPGNIKKYRVANNNLVDQTGALAVDPQTGFFYHAAKSFWTSGDPDGANIALQSGDADGDNVPAGGAAHKLPGPGSRKIYTYISGTTRPSTPIDLTGNISYSFTDSNTLLTSSTLGDASLTAVERTRLINWARGQDTQDSTDPSAPAGDNPNGSQTDARNVMGDPIHASPAVVIYGGTSDDPDTVVFVPTNDGYLHAIGGKDNEGVELWSFIPQELLSRIKPLRDNAVVSSKNYSLDGDVTVVKYDVNSDGIVNGNDRVIIVFGQGRGGSNYYALDVTDKNTPKFMWSIGPSELPGIGQAWSTPVLTRVDVSGATQNTQKMVLIFGGGYDPVEETPGYHAINSVGNRIFMVDLISGQRLWSAGSSGASLNLTRMDHSIPGSIKVIDFDDDGFADRMYAGDLAGQLWRFDIYSGQSASNLVTGGVIASLGDHDALTHTSDTNNRRFFAAPDAALVTPVKSSPYYNIAIGSGYRSHPLNTSTVDRFYAIRDRQPFTKLSQIAYGSLTILQDSTIEDITDELNPDPADIVNGWKLTLSSTGEKSLSSSTTFAGYIMFTSYTPGNSVSTTSGCNQISVGTNRLYTVNMIDGSPVKKANQDYTHTCTASTCTAADRSDTLDQGGIAPGVTLFFSDPNDGSGNTNTINATVGVEGVPAPKSGLLYKTYWKNSAGAGD